MYLIVIQHSCFKLIMTQIRKHYRYENIESNFDDVIEIFCNFFNNERFETTTYIIDELNKFKYNDIIFILKIFRDLFRKSAKQKLFILNKNKSHNKINIDNIISDILHIFIKQNNFENI